MQTFISENKKKITRIVGIQDKYYHKSSPFTQERHQQATQTQKEKRSENLVDGGLPHGRAEHEFVRHQLYQSRVDEDTRGDRVENAVDDEGRVALWGVALPHT